ncbi:MAG: hypothetical protein R6U96_12030 [Promethearchaeia archaeon]
MSLNLKERIGIHLDQIKQLKGVENAVLTQRDGNPIHSTGIWISKEEMFNICSAASAIYNVGIHLHPNDLRYILIEGKQAKILIAPLLSALHKSLNKIINRQNVIDQNHEYFIVITAQPDVNLGGIFLQTNECLRKIKISLITSGEEFKPPLIKFENNKIQNIMDGFHIKKGSKENLKLNPFSINLSTAISNKLKAELDSFSKIFPHSKYAFISVEGGFIVSKVLKNRNINRGNFDQISAMSYSLFKTADRCSWILKKMHANKIMLECKDSFQFILGLNKSIFCTEIYKNKQRLGLVRLFLAKISQKINHLLLKASNTTDESTFNLKRQLGELIIK